jgi:RNA polymerase sigma-70 factor (ECF subfamily)
MNESATEPDLEQVCRAEYPALVGFLALQTGSLEDAEDLAQSAIERLCAVWPTKRIECPQAWLRRVGLNLATSRWRRAARFRQRAPLLASTDRPSHEPAADDRLALHDALQQLSDRERAALLCRYYLDLSVADTATVMDTPANTIKTLTRRALQHLAASGLIRVDEPDRSNPIVTATDH